jgi:predicted TIM-barrel fold metal-dependent hydrolase
MFASNFTVGRLYGSYADLWNSFAEIMRDMTDAEKSGLFCNNAERIYRI